jgi:hypothetical protein
MRYVIALVVVITIIGGVWFNEVIMKNIDTRVLGNEAEFKTQSDNWRPVVEMSVQNAIAKYFGYDPLWSNVFHKYLKTDITSTGIAVDSFNGIVLENNYNVNNAGAAIAANHSLTMQGYQYINNKLSGWRSGLKITPDDASNPLILPGAAALGNNYYADSNIASNPSKPYIDKYRNHLIFAMNPQTTSTFSSSVELQKIIELFGNFKDALSESKNSTNIADAPNNYVMEFNTMAAGSVDDYIDDVMQELGHPQRAGGYLRSAIPAVYAFSGNVLDSLFTKNGGPVTLYSALDDLNVYMKSAGYSPEQRYLIMFASTVASEAGTLIYKKNVDGLRPNFVIAFAKGFMDVITNALEALTDVFGIGYWNKLLACTTYADLYSEVQHIIQSKSDAVGSLWNKVLSEMKLEGVLTDLKSVNVYTMFLISDEYINGINSQQQIELISKCIWLIKNHQSNATNEVSIPILAVGGTVSFSKKMIDAFYDNIVGETNTSGAIPLYSSMYNGVIKNFLLSLYSGETSKEIMRAYKIYCDGLDSGGSSMDAIVNYAASLIDSGVDIMRLESITFEGSITGALVAVPFMITGEKLAESFGRLLTLLVEETSGNIAMNKDGVIVVVVGADMERTNTKKNPPEIYAGSSGSIEMFAYKVEDTANHVYDGQMLQTSIDTFMNSQWYVNIWVELYGNPTLVQYESKIPGIRVNVMSNKNDLLRMMSWMKTGNPESYLIQINKAVDYEKFFEGDE